MELVVGVLAVVGLVLVADRFLLRDATGRVRLPRIVDDSIGMWVLRRITGRPLGRSSDLPDADPLARFRRPSTTLAVRVDPRRRIGRGSAPEAPNAARSSVAAPLESAWSVVERRPSSSRPFGASILAPPATDPAAAPPDRRFRLSWVVGAALLGLLLGGAAALVAR